MATGLHMTLEEVRKAVQTRGGNLACPICASEEFVMEEATVLGAGKQEAYGGHRLKRAQLICENCAFVINFDLARLERLAERR
ncbi:MAG TPA: hypothetical protein VFJ72_02715 [Rubrobacteraceae bacterium]|nr:hypothetical protein [Rubrobacteraceae bacterium]